LEWTEGGEEGWERTGRKREGMICRGGEGGEGKKRAEQEWEAKGWNRAPTPIVRNLMLFQCLLI